MVTVALIFIVPFCLLAIAFAAMALRKRPVEQDVPISPFRLRIAADRIGRAITEQLDYEEAHGERQAERLKHHERELVGPTHQRLELRRYVVDGDTRQRSAGHYDQDQREHSVLLKVRYSYLRAGEAPPEGLELLVRKALLR